ncbi:hypothetical protein [Streptomyces sp. SID10362]|uniref:hypothetical protein n=1 Tax=Streptomyces sp. SID10362 TaxID=2706021 RepID=UPI001F152ABB|nr:hypothetical protein [Streptomyces sp. SID10362]
MTERLENPTQHCRRPLPRTTLGARFVLTAEEPAALPILDSRPDEATVARGFEEVDAGCWSDSGDVTVYAERTYAFPGTRADVAAHYRTAARRDGWRPDPDAGSGNLSFVKKTMKVRIIFLTTELLAEEGHGSRRPG